jgi:photosystem II protein
MADKSSFEDDKTMAEIQFSRGITEPAVPNVRLTRSPDGQNGTATFYFDSPQVLSQESNEEVTGMYLIDEEGEMVSKEVKAKFINGRPKSLESILLLNSPTEWDRFMRFMERYAEEHGLEFRKS